MVRNRLQALDLKGDIAVTCPRAGGSDGRALKVRESPGVCERVASSLY